MISRDLINLAIVGGGQSGLGLALYSLKLFNKGSRVSVFTNKSGTDLALGTIMSNQGIFGSALDLERRLGLNFWDTICPQNKAISFTLTTPGSAKKMIHWVGYTTKPYQSIDQRVKFSRWMNEFETLGGKLYIEDVDFKELDRIAKWHDLTIVAGGKSEISQVFPINKVRSHFDKPQRALACLYVNGIIPDEDYNKGVHANIIPGVGEFFIMPGLTLNNAPCEMMLFEGIPNGPFDCWHDLINPEEQLEKAIALLKKYLPWEAERCQHARLTDNKGTLLGSYTPVVRHPTVKMPCGKFVLGIGDTVVLNDPIAGQGANNAMKAAHLYATSIHARKGKEFDEMWMHETFERYWQEYAKWSTKWSSLLLMSPAPHIIALLKAAETSQTIANMLADGFDDPSILFPWIMNPEDTLRIIKTVKENEQDIIYNKGLSSRGFRP